MTAQLFHQRLLVFSGLLISAGIYFCLIGPQKALAEQILLKEGKTIYGRITDQDEKEVTLKLGPDMFLRVEKSKIKQIVRENPDGSTQVIFPPPKSVGPKTSESVEGQAAPREVEKKRAPTLLDFLQNPKEEKLFRSHKKESVALQETMIRSIYSVSGPQFDAAKAAVLDPDHGRGFIEEGRRRASKVSLACRYDGQPAKEGPLTKWGKVLVVATITVTEPSWNAPVNVSSKDVSAWNQFVGEVQKYDLERSDLYVRSLVSMGEALASLREADEKQLKDRSEEMYKTQLFQIQKRLKGFERRREATDNRPKKDTPPSKKTSLPSVK